MGKKRKKRTDPEWLKFREESERHLKEVRERLAREYAKLDAKEAAARDPS